MTFATVGTQNPVTATDSKSSAITGSGSTNVAAPAVATHFSVVLPSQAPAASRCRCKLSRLGRPAPAGAELQRHGHAGQQPRLGHVYAKRRNR